ncbi:heat- and acid-stable phosphoprotein, partial [Trifolium pratense]
RSFIFLVTLAAEVVTYRQFNLLEPLLVLELLDRFLSGSFPLAPLAPLSSNMHVITHLQDFLFILPIMTIDFYMDMKEAENEEEPEVVSGDESGEESDGETKKKKGTQGIIEIENPNLVKPKTLKARDVDVEKTTELSRREREEIEKHKAHERYMRLQEQGKTDQSKKDLERLALIRQQRAEAAKKRDEEKAAKEKKKAETLK